MEKYNLIVIGAGAAGYFAAIAAAESNPSLKVLLIEKNRQVLAKVRISGGGRCNVTHHLFDPKELSRYYPRGEKELVGPFHRFQPKDTVEWFAKRGVKLKAEEDGRMFPVTDSSETIIEALEQARRKAGVELLTEMQIESIEKTDGNFRIATAASSFETPCLLLATGSSPQGYRFAESLGHTITKIAPSLFSFNVPTSPLLDLSGISMPDVEASIKGTKLKQRGPLLLTHWGFSGPAILRLSAWGARILQEMGYQADLEINWAPSLENFHEKMASLKKTHASKPFQLQDFVAMPKQLAERLSPVESVYAHLKASDIKKIEEVLHRSCFKISGKTTYKQEFVTCGGISLKEVDFRTMESKKCPGLYFAGEVLDIDGVTGGFNFQNAWTTGWIAGKSVSARF